MFSKTIGIASVEMQRVPLYPKTTQRQGNCISNGTSGFLVLRETRLTERDDGALEEVVDVVRPAECEARKVPIKYICLNAKYL